MSFSGHLISNWAFIPFPVLNMLFSDCLRSVISLLLRKFYMYLLPYQFFWFILVGKLVSCIPTSFDSNILLFADLGKMPLKTLPLTGLRNTIRVCFRKFILGTILHLTGLQYPNQIFAGTEGVLRLVCSFVS